MAVAALLLWLCTAAIGSYLLVTAVHAGNTRPEPGESVPVPAEQPAAARTVPERPPERWIETISCPAAISGS